MKSWMQCMYPTFIPNCVFTLTCDIFYQTCYFSVMYLPIFSDLNKPDNKITMKKDPMMKEEVPMVKINGPTIHLPSFPLISDQLKLFSSNSATMEDHDHDDMDMAEQRTAAIITDDEDFNLNFFPMRNSLPISTKKSMP